MSQPLFTCAILCYNYGRFLTTAIESCLSQTIDNTKFEILVIDDGSTDETPIICENYKNQIRYSRTVNLGFAKSIERALNESKGRFIVFLDADDWWEKDKLSILEKHLKPETLVLIHPLKEVDETGHLLGKVGACGNTSSVCVDRKAGLTLMPTTSEIFCRPLLDVGKGSVINIALGNYRIHNNAMTDRSSNTLHTEFFAHTNFVLAKCLKDMLQNGLPFWATDEKQILQLSNYYFAEWEFKLFERSTELHNVNLSSIKKIVKTFRNANRELGKREFRLFSRVLLQKLGLK